MASWKKVITSGSSPEFNSVTLDGTLNIPGFSNVSSSLASLNSTSITSANLAYTSSGICNSIQPTHITNLDGSLKIIASGSRSVILNSTKNYPNIITGSLGGEYATETIVNGYSNTIRQTGNNGSTVENSGVVILNGSSNLISSSVDSTILAGYNGKIQGVRFSSIGGGISNCIITNCVSGGSCTSVGNSIVNGQHNKISGSSSTFNNNSFNIIGGGHQNVSYQTGYSIIGSGFTNRILGNNATFGNSNKEYHENSIVGGRCNDIIDEKNSHIIGGACNKIIGDSTQNTVIQGSGNIIGAGHSNTITDSCCSAILGGKENCLKHNHSFIIGSCITSSANCTTFVNNLCVLGNLNTDGTDSNVVYQRGTGTDSVKPINGSNTVSGNCSTILGGCSNSIETADEFNTILNGRCNQISGSRYSAILGGQCNTASYTDCSLISGVSNKIIDTTEGSADYRSTAVTILGGNSNNVYNWYTGTNLSTSCRAYNIGLFNSSGTKISGSRAISILGGTGHDVITTASNGSHSSTVCNTSFVGGIGNMAGSNTINSIVNGVSFIGGTTNCAFRGGGEIIGGKNNCFLNSGSGFSFAVTIGGCQNTQINSTGLSGRDNNIIAGGRYNSIDGAVCSNILGGSSNCLKLTGNSHILGNASNSKITGSSNMSPNISANNTIIGGCNVNLYNTSGIIAIGVNNRTISNCQISSNQNKVFMDTLEVKNLCTTSEIESPIGKFEKLRGASPITSEDTINITASFDSGAFTHPALILSGSEAIQATGSVSISGSLSITGFPNVSSSLASASSIPTLQQVTTAGNSTDQGLIVSGSTIFKPETSLAASIEFSTEAYSGRYNPTITLKNSSDQKTVHIGHSINDGLFELYNSTENKVVSIQEHFQAFSPPGGISSGYGTYFGVTSSISPSVASPDSYVKIAHDGYSAVPYSILQLNKKGTFAGSGSITLQGIMNSNNNSAPSVGITSVNGNRVVNFGGPGFVNANNVHNNYLKYGLQVGGDFTGNSSNMALTDGSLIMSGSTGGFSVKSVSSEAEIKTNDGDTTLTLGTTSSLVHVEATTFKGDGSQLTNLNTTTPTLQQVTDAGASTTTAVTLANLTVTGTASFQHTTDLDIADRFVKLASGSNVDGVGGIAIQQTSATNAQAFGWDNATGRWGITSSFNASQNTFTPSAYMGTVINGTDDNPNNLDSSFHKAGNIYVDTDKSIDGIWLFG
jgi:hypothetical protein